MKSNDRSLLRMDANGRYSLQELLRQYAQYQLECAGEIEATADAHCAYYAAFLNARVSSLKGADQIRALDEIEAEIDNLRLSWHWAVAQGKEREILQSLEGLARFLEMHSRYGEGEEVFGLAAARFSNGPNEVSGQLQMFQAWFAYNQCKWEQAADLFQSGLAMLPHVDAYPAMVMPLRLHKLSLNRPEFGDYETVLKRFQAHLAAARKRDGGWAAAWFLMCMGEFCWASGKSLEAQPYYLSPLRIVALARPDSPGFSRHPLC